MGGLIGFEHALATVKKYSEPRLRKEIQSSTKAVGKVVARRIRAEAPVGATGKLKRSVRVKASRASLGATVVKPTAHHAHLVIRGHRIVTRSGVDTGRRARSNPFVDRAVAGLSEAKAVMRAELFKHT